MMQYRDENGWWFEEKSSVEKGASFRIRLKSLLHRSRSRYQDIEVYETKSFGRMLALDGLLMLTEYDEHCYHEMIAHVPLITHPQPRRVLVIGGGDGATVREVAKHGCVEEIHLCEIDEEVVDVCKKHFPKLTGSLADPRVEVFYEDGSEYAKKNKGYYDVVIVDSSDPVGPNEALFRKQFYQDARHALAPSGIIVNQSSSIFYSEDVVKGVREYLEHEFPMVAYYYTMVPSYPSGMIGFHICCLDDDPMNPARISEADKLPELKYYGSHIHAPSFALPRFAHEYLKND